MKQYTIIIDSREQAPLDFSQVIAATSEANTSEGWQVQGGTLPHGDYSLMGGTRFISLERKSLPDLVACVGRERERFEKELLALRGYRCRAVVIEATLKNIESGKWRGQILPAHVLGSIAGWRAKLGIEFIYAGDPEGAAAETFRLIRKFKDFLQDTMKLVQF